MIPSSLKLLLFVLSAAGLAATACGLWHESSIIWNTVAAAFWIRVLWVELRNPTDTNTPPEAPVTTSAGERDPVPRTRCPSASGGRGL